MRLECANDRIVQDRSGLEILVFFVTCCLARCILTSYGDISHFLDTANGKDSHLSSIGDRLKTERVRLDLSQSAFAEIGGVQKNAQVNYESGKRAPDASYLAAISAAGADVLYILTGRREPGFAPLSVAQAFADAFTAPGQPKPFTFPDAELPRLESALIAVEAGIAERDRPLEIEQKAALVVAAFDLLADASAASRARVIRLVKAT